MIYLKIGQVVIAVLMAVSILLQNRGAALSGVFGGSDNIYRTKRGVEKFLFISTIIFAVAFFAVSVMAMIVQKES